MITRALLVAILVLAAPTWAADNPLARGGIHSGQTAKLDEILDHVRAIRALLEAAKPPAPPTDPTPKPPDPKPAEPTPPVPAAPNPFIAWRAAGYDLVYIQGWILHRGLTPAELEQARAAGYLDAPAPSGTGGAPPPADDFTREGPAFGRHLGRSKICRGPAGTLCAYTITPPANGGAFALKVAETTSTEGHADQVRVWFDRSGCERADPGSGTFTTVSCPAGLVGTVGAFVQLLQAGAVSVQVNNP